MTELITPPPAAPQPVAPATDRPSPQSRLWTAALVIDWEKALYLLFIALAFITRFWGLGDRVMSHDESLHTQYSYQYYIGDGYEHTPLMHGPFLFHATAFSYWLFGAANDFTARVPVALLGVLLVFIPYFLRDWIGRKGALFASFLFLISPYITYYSRYIRHDIYIIIWAMIVVIAMWYYMRQRQEKYLYWFAAGVALMFCTKEVSFIYVAIFGSFLVMRLAVLLWTSDWFRDALPKLSQAAILLGVAILLLGAGFGGKYITGREATSQAVPTESSSGFAANPNEAQPAADTGTAGGNGIVFRWLEIAGIGAFAAAILIGVSKLRPRLDDYPEFDLILLFSTLVLPTVSPLLTTLAGWNPRDYSFNQCYPPGSESLSTLQLFFARITDGSCYTAFFTSGLVRSGIFLVFTLLVAIFVGLWWNKRRWLIAAAVFHSIFLILYTSVFTNPGGWTSGMIGSLGYWLEQQGVARGGQPWFYYFFAMPFYEFLPLLLTLLAAAYWTRRHRLHQIAGYWLGILTGGLFAGSIVNLLVYRGKVAQAIALANAQAEGAGQPLPAPLRIRADVPTSWTPLLITFLVIVVVGLVYWFLVRRGQIRAKYQLQDGEYGHVSATTFVDFVPFLFWWFLLTFVIYTVAGEKMPWLSTHFVIPMALAGGWYLQQRFADFHLRDLWNRHALLLIGVSVALVGAAFLAFGPLLLGKVPFGQQEQANLAAVGRLLGSFLMFGGMVYVWRLAAARSEAPNGEAAIRQRIPLITLLIILGAVTIRFTYMANFPNADYTNEFLVYAHGAPSTKDIVMQQIDELSLRLNGDKSMKVAFDNVSSWPYLWYLRDYPNRIYYGENPGSNILDAPVILVGDTNYSKVEPLVGEDYEMTSHIFLWWPMEEYRKLGWNALIGDNLTPADQRRGLGKPAVRQALWDIFWLRDYTQYGEVFGGSYTAGQWPLRRPLRLYIRKDVYADLWDYGAAAAAYEPPPNPYAEGELTPVASLSIGTTGSGPGQLMGPHNVAVAGNGMVYVLDAGNSRVAVFNPDGSFVTSWGQAGDQPGQFNDPWGIAVNDEFVFVADTWNYRIQKFTRDGQVVLTFGASGSPAEGQSGGGLFYGPRDIILLPDNRLLVTDTGNHRLQLFDQDGNFLQSVGSLGSLLGQMHEPVGLALGPTGDIFLADTWNSRIQRFSADLVPLSEWKISAWKGQSIVNKPYLAVDSGGRLYVTDPEGYRILIFNAGGQYLGRFGAFGTDLLQFGLPQGIAVDAQNNVYVVDSANNRVLKFNAADIGGSLPVP